MFGNKNIFMKVSQKYCKKFPSFSWSFLLEERRSFENLLICSLYFLFSYNLAEIMQYFACTTDIYIYIYMILALIIFFF